MLRRRTSKDRLKIQDLCYDNRIYILEYLPFCDKFRLGDGVCFKYDAGSHTIKYFGYLRHDYDRSGRVLFKNSLSFILKHLYGYFKSDVMRKIYKVEYRLSITLYIDDMPSKSLKIRFKDISPFKTREIRAHITCQLSSKISNVSYDLSDLSLSSLVVSTYDELGNILEEVNRTRFFGLDYLFISLTDSKEEFLDLQLWNRVLRKPRWIFFRNDGIKGFTKTNECEEELIHKSYLRKVLLVLSETITQFPKQFFYSFSNLNSMTIIKIHFRDSIEKNTFFKNLRTYAPKLVRLYMFELIIENRDLVDDDNHLRILCSKKPNRVRESPYFFAMKYDEEMKKNPHLLNFRNEEIRFFIINNSKIEDEPLPLDISFFSRFYELFPGLNALGFRNLSCQKNVYTDLPSIIQKIPNHINRVEILFPRYECDENLLACILPMSARLRVLSISFKNIVDHLETILLTFQNLDTLIVNDIKHFGEKSIVEGIKKPIPNMRNIFMLFRDYLKKLRRMRICFEGLEPLVYFLKYSLHTQHVGDVRTKFQKSMISQRFLELRENNAEHDPFYYSQKKHRKYPDQMDFTNFERGVEYFMEEEGNDQRTSPRIQCYLRRRSENEKFEFFEDPNSREIQTTEDRITTDATLMVDFLWESRWVFPNVEFILKKYSIVPDQKSAIIMDSLKVHFVKNGRIHKFQLTLGIVESLEGMFTLRSKNNVRIRSSFCMTKREKGQDEQRYTITFNDFESLSGRVRRTWISFGHFSLFGKVFEGGVNRYEFISPYTLDYIRFCVSSSRGEGKERREEWISRKNFIRMILSMVGVDFQNGRLGIAYIEKENSKVAFLDVNWIFRECQRVYGIDFEELEGIEPVEFIDCMFEK